ncbi:transglutaminase-like domain-containing protein [Seonamhaeicola sp.]|uniref:transglutaminase-like domain-containing protein n=1 Tax=Seonamhaeicola sp. TaxID=1912245 RepID=UPI002611854A|nr:transglutaminase-like domain-containing protein [Seonamhaeicola sp.]
MKIYEILGLDERAWHMSSVSIKKSYKNIGYALIFVSVISIATGIEITSQFTHAVSILLFGGITYGGMVFCVDYFLVSGESTKFGFIVRAIFGSSNVVLGVISFLLLINTNDINNYNQSINTDEFNSLTDSYLEEKAKRYSIANEKEAIIASYHKANCVKEANIVYAGPKYDKIHNAFCVKEEVKLAALKEELDKEELVFKKIFEEEKAILNNVSRLGLFEKVDILLKKIILPNPYKIGFAFILFVFLLGMEFTAMFSKLNIKKDNSYSAICEKIVEDDIKKAHKKLSDENEISEIESNNHQKLIKTEMEIDYKVMEFLTVERMKTEFLKAKAVSPELWTEDLTDKCHQYFEEKSYNLSEHLKQVFNIEVDHNTMDEKYKSPIQNKANIFNVFYLTVPMKLLAENLLFDAKKDLPTFIVLLFDWSIKNLSYDKAHDISHYKNARDVFNTRRGVCGELTIFFNAMCKYAAIKADYVHIDIDLNGQKVNHACSGINLNGDYQLIDVSYRLLKGAHRQWNPISNEQLMQNLGQWNS